MIVPNRTVTRFLISWFCLTALLSGVGGLAPGANAQQSQPKTQDVDVLRTFASGAGWRA